jgi:protoheme IX farnesyltransferase
VIKEYYRLIKPGIVYGNAIPAVAGFLLASRGDIQYGVMLAMLVGISLVVASGCVFNNYIDRDIDALMERTKKRALVTGLVNKTAALRYAVTLFSFGVGLLAVSTNRMTVYAALLGFLVYVVIYSLFVKRTSMHGALIGSISGAMPLVVGYLAVHGVLDSEAVILFLIMSLWQMPHSLAIAIYRLRDYQAADISVTPVRKGIRIAKIEIVIYTKLFITATLSLYVFGYVTYLYFFIMGALGYTWLILALYGLFKKNIDDATWARRVFLFSIIILLVFCIMISSSYIAK